MRRFVSGLLIIALAACGHSTDSTERYGKFEGPVSGVRGFAVGDAIPEFRLRADSLAALDPIREAFAAVNRGDLRYLAACNPVCMPLGIAPDTDCLRAYCISDPPSEIHVIRGAGLPAVSVDMARLDSVAKRFGARYNPIIREARKRIRPVAPVA